MLKSLHDRGKTNWVTHIKNLLCLNGFGLVWMIGEVSNQKTFIAEFKLRLSSDFSFQWLTHIQNSPRFELYGAFKSCLEQEKYINQMHVDNYLRVFARFRIGVSEINAHRHRFSTQLETKHCPFCPTEIEDELHVIFTCHMYKDLRKDLIEPLQISIKSQLLHFMSGKDPGDLFSFSKYLFLMIQQRRKALQ
jgi:hypothetical protein